MMDKFTLGVVFILSLTFLLKVYYSSLIEITSFDVQMLSQEHISAICFKYYPNQSMVIKECINETSFYFFDILENGTLVLFKG